MEKRDLKADLEWMMNAPSDHAKELEIAVHALERAIEAEKNVAILTLIVADLGLELVNWVDGSGSKERADLALIKACNVLRRVRNDKTRLKS